MSEEVHSRFRKFGKTVLFFLLPIVVLGWTSVPATAPFTLHLGIAALLIAIGASFYKKEEAQVWKTVIHTLVILFLVGGTGWFLSPFFFLLYLLPVYLGFIFAPAVAFGFLAALLIIFASSIGEVDPAFDMMTLLSLLLVIPLVIFLRKKYLVLRQSEKDILILESEGSGVKDMDTINRLLANRVTNLGVTVRQPLTFVKQAATTLLGGSFDPEETRETIKRIETTAAEALGYVRQFEKDTSANQVLTNRPEKTIEKPSEELATREKK